MSARPALSRQAGCVAIAGRGVLIEGAPGTGKSSLALALIDRGATLVGDDGIVLVDKRTYLAARPHPRTRGLLEVRNLGLLEFPCKDEIPVALVIALDPSAPRYVDQAETIDIADARLPLVRIWPQDHPPALKVELALRHYGLPF